MTIERCGDCRWFHAKERECRKNPPKPFVFPGVPSALNNHASPMTVMGIWPSTREGEWCGGFVPKAEA